MFFSQVVRPQQQQAACAVAVVVVESSWKHLGLASDMKHAALQINFGLSHSERYKSHVLFGFSQEEIEAARRVSRVRKYPVKVVAYSFIIQNYALLDMKQFCSFEILLYLWDTCTSFSYYLSLQLRHTFAHLYLWDTFVSLSYFCILYCRFLYILLSLFL